MLIFFYNKSGYTLKCVEKFQEMKSYIEENNPKGRKLYWLLENVRSMSNSVKLQINKSVKLLTNQ